MADEGGDAPCWAERVCAHCGAIADPDVEHACLDVVGLDDVHFGAAGNGVVWALTGARQLEANLVVLTPDGAIGQHPNNEVDVLIVVLDGDGVLSLDGIDKPLRAHTLALVPCGVTRAIAAGPSGMRYLSIHRLRTGPSISRGQS
jgi:quercetin dioxygenase-like cupin family protein